MKFICKDCDTPCYYDNGAEAGEFVPKLCISCGDDELVTAGWEVVDDANPLTVSQKTAKHTEALLEVIKQKDAIIDSCRSSLEEYRQKSYDDVVKISHLELKVDRTKYEEYLKLERGKRDAESQLRIMTGRYENLKFNWDNRWSKAFEDAPIWLLIGFLCLMIGVGIGICL